MIGLLFLGAALLWLALSVFVALQLPNWFGMSKPVARWLTSAAVFLLLMVGPFVDHIVGMRQFGKLCEERTSPRISADAGRVDWATRKYSPFTRLQGYAIDIDSSTATFTDDSSGKTFLSYEYFRTRGGRVAGIAMMGGWHSCSAESNKYYSNLKMLPAYLKTVNGVKK